jgi:hypothetical protein
MIIIAAFLPEITHAFQVSNSFSIPESLMIMH